MNNDYSLVKDNMTPEYVKNLPLEKLPLFCDQLRAKLIDIVSKTGGHIGVNVGVVELTVALYRVFDFPNDSLVWDIGHQMYVQKMITGRLKNLETMRKNDGSPGYAFREESIFDRVTSSHAGASFSFALGTAIANKLNKKNEFSVAVVGDGSYVEGCIQEAVNHMAVENSKMITILNDNERAIEENFGGLHEYFKKRKLGNDEKETFFSSLEIPYFGPFDGHNVLELIEKFTEIKNNFSKPTIIHVKTVKGKGLESMAENSSMKIHWNHKFDPKTLQNTEFPRSKGYAAYAGESIENIMSENLNAILITPAVQSNLGITKAFEKFKDRCFDVSLAEQHSVTLGGGFALSNMKPIIAMESTFMPRAYDQIIHDLCINKLPVLIIAARSGHGGTDHVTHNALQDISYLRCIPNLRIRYISSHKNIDKIFTNEFLNLHTPTVILFAKADELDDVDEEIITDDELIFNKNSQSKGLILTIGSQTKNGFNLKNILNSNGVSFDHIAVTHISPLSSNLTDLIKEYSYVVTMEEGFLNGGFGSSIVEFSNDNNLNNHIMRIGFPQKFIEHGSREYLYEKYKIDYKSIFNTIKEDWSELWGN